MINYKTFSNISYGMYIVCSGDKNKGNGYISNTVSQVTSEPPLFATCCNKNNLTCDFIKKYGAFSVSVLEQNAPSELIGKFGFRSGNDIDKMNGSNIRYGETGVPIVLNNCLAFFEFKVVNTVDLGTHLMFIGELVNAETLDETGQPMTYLYYKEVKKGLSPKNAPTYIDKSKFETEPADNSLKKYECLICGYLYDETVEKIKFVDLPDDWVCPVCYAEKSEFKLVK